jgi:hypothetical protein
MWWKIRAPNTKTNDLLTLFIQFIYLAQLVREIIFSNAIQPLTGLLCYQSSLIHGIG